MSVSEITKEYIFGEIFQFRQKMSTPEFWEQSEKHVKAIHSLIHAYMVRPLTNDEDEGEVENALEVVLLEYNLREAMMRGNI